LPFAAVTAEKPDTSGTADMAENGKPRAAWIVTLECFAAPFRCGGTRLLDRAGRMQQPPLGGGKSQRPVRHLPDKAVTEVTAESADAAVPGETPSYTNPEAPLAPTVATAAC
jgi:hypothetical protein